LFNTLSFKQQLRQKSLVNLFKGCGCGQRPQILSVYCNLTIAKQLAVWRLEHNGESQMRQQQREKARY